MSSHVASVLAPALGCFHILEPCPNYQRITHRMLNLIGIVILLVGGGQSNGSISFLILAITLYLT